MAVDTSIPRTRRALLAGGIGGAAALAASALGRPRPSEAGNGDALILGKWNSATLSTGVAADLGMDLGGSFSVVNSAKGGEAISSHAEYGIAIGARTSTGLGLWADAMGMGTGVYGKSGGRTGVLGVSGGSCCFGYPTSPAKTGVYGYATQDANARGVTGETTAGRGVNGVATSGVGLYGTATTGYALRTSGRVRLDKCAGVATIAATKTSVVVTPGLDVTTASFVLLTPKGDLGTRRLWYTANPTANTFTIKVSSAVPANLQVGWLLLG